MIVTQYIYCIFLGSMSTAVTSQPSTSMHMAVASTATVSQATTSPVSHEEIQEVHT